MISTQIHFWVSERKNVYRQSGREWALYAQLVGHDAWVIKTWEEKPSAETVADTKATIMRAFVFYHRHLQIPYFAMEVVDS